MDYFFTTRENFEEMIQQDEFIEYALVYEDYKGVPKPQIREALASGKDVILRVDVQGAATLRALCPEALLIFLIPDNQEEWLERLMQPQDRNGREPGRAHAHRAQRARTAEQTSTTWWSTRMTGWMKRWTRS